MSNLIIRWASPEDVLYLEPRLRPIDRLELELGSLMSARSSLLYGISYPSARAVRLDGRCLALFGCTPLAVGGGPWAAFAPEMFQHWRFLLRGSRRFVGLWLDQYQYLTNFCHVDNREVLRWLHWLGFKFAEPADIGRHRLIRFYKEKEHV